jgi:glycosyltransferase involved in cell wall biosynthesis
MPKKIKILFFDHAMFMSGAEYSLLDILKGLKDKRLDISLLAVQNGQLFNAADGLGIKTHSIFISDNLLRVGKRDIQYNLFKIVFRLGSIFKTIYRIHRLLRLEKIEIIYTNTIKSHILGGLAGRMAGTGVIWHMRDIPVQKRPRHIMGLAAFLLPHKIIAISKAVAAQFNYQKTTVIHNAIDVLEIQNKAERALPVEIANLIRIGEGRPRIGIVGQIARWKGQNVFLQAAGSIIEKMPSGLFFIVGDDIFDKSGFKHELQNFVDNNNLGKNVIFTGNVENIYPVMKSFDILAHCSVEPEPFGRVLIESMALGVPVIATSGGGVDEIIRHGENGLIVHTNNPEELALAMEKIYNDTILYGKISKNGLKSVNKQFYLNEMLNKINKIIIDLRW